MINNYRRLDTCIICMNRVERFVPHTRIPFGYCCNFDQTFSVDNYYNENEEWFEFHSIEQNGICDDFIKDWILQEEDNKNE